MQMCRLQILRPILSGRCFLIRYRPLSNIQEPNDQDREREIAKIAENASIHEPPTTCCRSGCSNCVFIVWAEALSAKMAAGGPDVVNKVLELVDDPSLKAYLEMELRMRGLKK